MELGSSSAPRTPDERSEGFACVACSRRSSSLSALAEPGTGLLLEVCRSCYCLEETRRLAARLPEGSAFFARYLSLLQATYLEVRAAVALEEAEPSSDDGSPPGCGCR